MSINTIKALFELKIASITPTITTQYQNVVSKVVSGVPFQTLHLIPAFNQSLYINEDDYKSVGIFQINLYYPLNVGTKDIMNRADLYLSNFKNGSKLTNGTVEVSIMGVPEYKIIGEVNDRFVVVVSVNYKSYLK